MWFTLPNELRMIIFDFHGDIRFRHHRLHRFVQAEIGAFNILARHYRHGWLRASLISRVEGFKYVLQLAYTQAQREALLKNHGGTGIP